MAMEEDRINVRKLTSSQLLRYERKRRELDLTWNDVNWEEVELVEGDGNPNKELHVKIINTNPAFKELFAGQREETKYCDLVLATDDGYVPVHRVFIQENSDFLDELIKENMRVSPPTKDSPVTITLDGFTVKQVKTVLTLLYTGETYYASEDEWKILDLMQYLRIHHLRENCVRSPYNPRDRHGHGHGRKIKFILGFRFSDVSGSDNNDSAAEDSVTVTTTTTTTTNTAAEVSSTNSPSTRASSSNPGPSTSRASASASDFEQSTWVINDDDDIAVVYEASSSNDQGPSASTSMTNAKTSGHSNGKKKKGTKKRAQWKMKKLNKKKEEFQQVDVGTVLDTFPEIRKVPPGSLLPKKKQPRIKRPLPEPIERPKRAKISRESELLSSNASVATAAPPPPQQLDSTEMAVPNPAPSVVSNAPSAPPPPPSDGSSGIPDKLKLNLFPPPTSPDSIKLKDAKVVVDKMNDSQMAKLMDKVRKGKIIKIKKVPGVYVLDSLRKLKKSFGKKTNATKKKKKSVSFAVDQIKNELVVDAVMEHAEVVEVPDPTLVPATNFGQGPVKAKASAVQKGIEGMKRGMELANFSDSENDKMSSGEGETLPAPTIAQPADLPSTSSATPPIVIIRPGPSVAPALEKVPLSSVMRSSSQNEVIETTQTQTGGISIADADIFRVPLVPPKRRIRRMTTIGLNSKAPTTPTSSDKVTALSSGNGDPVTTPSAQTDIAVAPDIPVPSKATIAPGSTSTSSDEVAVSCKDISSSSEAAASMDTTTTVALGTNPSASQLNLGVPTNQNQSVSSASDQQGPQTQASSRVHVVLVYRKMHLQDNHVSNKF